MLTVNPAPTTGASCQEGLADSGTAAARVLQSPVSSIQSPVLDLPLSCVSAFAVLYLHRLNTPCLNTLLDVGAERWLLQRSVALQPAVLYARAQGGTTGLASKSNQKQHSFASSTPVPRDVSRDSGATPLALLGGTNPGRFARNVPMVPPPLHPPLHPYSLTRSRWTSVVRSSSPSQPASGTVLPGRLFPGKNNNNGGSFVKLGQDTFNAFLLELECFLLHMPGRQQDFV